MTNVTDVTLKNQILSKCTKIIELITEEECEDYFQKFLANNECDVLGVDVEYCGHSPVLLQISDFFSTAIVRLNLYSSLPKSLVTLLTSKNYLKIGVGVIKDIES